MPDYGEGIALFMLFAASSLVAIPIGLVAGGLTGLLASKVSVLLGTGIGLGAGLLGIAVNVFMLWASVQMDLNLGVRHPMFLLMLFSPATIAGTASFLARRSHAFGGFPAAARPGVAVPDGYEGPEKREKTGEPAQGEVKVKGKG